MQRKPKSYSSALMDQIPIKYLIRQAQGLQQELGGMSSWELHISERKKSLVWLVRSGLYQWEGLRIIHSRA